MPNPISSKSGSVLNTYCPDLNHLQIQLQLRLGRCSGFPFPVQNSVVPFQIWNWNASHARISTQCQNSRKRTPQQTVATHRSSRLSQNESLIVFNRDKSTSQTTKAGADFRPWKSSPACGIFFLEWLKTKKGRETDSSVANLKEVDWKAIKVQYLLCQEKSKLHEW